MTLFDALLAFFLAAGFVAFLAVFFEGAESETERQEQAINNK